MTAKVGRAAAISTPPRPRRRRHFHIKMADESAEEASRESTQCDPDKAGEGEWLDVLGSGQLRKKVRAICSMVGTVRTLSECNCRGSTL